MRCIPHVPLPPHPMAGGGALRHLPQGTFAIGHPTIHYIMLFIKDEAVRIRHNASPSIPCAALSGKASPTRVMQLREPASDINPEINMIVYFIRILRLVELHRGLSMFMCKPDNRVYRTIWTRSDYVKKILHILPCPGRIGPAMADRRNYCAKNVIRSLDCRIALP